MHVDDWIEQAVEAAMSGGVGAVRDVIARGVADPELPTTIGFEGPLCTRILFRSPVLTLTAHRFPPGLRIPRHDHGMAAVVGVCSGVEEHLLADGPRRIGEGQVLELPADVVHGVATAPDRETIALHAYLGDLHGASRTTWDPLTGAPSPHDEALVRRLEAVFVRRAAAAPIPADQTMAVVVDIVAGLRSEPRVPVARTAEGVAWEVCGDGRPVVFLHGLTYGRQAWDPIVERLPDFRCVTLDLPGHGDSTDAGGFGLEDSVRAIRGVVEASGLVDPVLVGHSAGAVLSLQYAARYRTGGLVFVDQPLMVGPFARQVQSLADALRSPAFGRAWMPFERSMGYRALPHGIRSALLEHHRVRQEVVTGAWRSVLDGDPAVLEQQFEAMLAALDVPVMSLHGRDVPPYGGWLRARVAHAQVETWPGHGHFPQLADAPRFAQRLRTFLRGVGPVRLESVRGCRRLPTIAAALEAAAVDWSVGWVPEGTFAEDGEVGPALFDGEARLLGTVEILTHVAARAGLDGDPAAVARWLDLCQGELAPALKRLRASDDAAARAVVTRWVGDVDQALADRDWLLGAFGPADLMALPLVANGLAGTPVPARVEAWMTRVVAHPSVRRSRTRIEADEGFHRGLDRR